MTTLNAVLPLFAMIGLGFLAARMRLLNEAAIQGLVNYIFFFAIPPMLIVMLSKADPEKLLAGGPFLMAMFSAELAVALLAAFWARWTYGRVGPAAYGILGFSACFSNGVLLAVPLVSRSIWPRSSRSGAGAGDAGYSAVCRGHRLARIWPDGRARRYVGRG